MNSDSFGSCGARATTTSDHHSLCTLAAHRVASGAACLAFGEPDTGLIVVPARPGATGETGLDRADLTG